MGSKISRIRMIAGQAVGSSQTRKSIELPSILVLIRRGDPTLAVSHARSPSPHHKNRTMSTTRQAAEVRAQRSPVGKQAVFEQLIAHSFCVDNPLALSV